MGQIHWSWEAEVKEGELENFRALVKRWNKIANKDPENLSNEWMISEDSRSVRVTQTFTNSAAALNQFESNLWASLDKHVIPKQMYVCGDYGNTLDFLKKHGATFMVQIT